MLYGYFSISLLRHGKKRAFKAKPFKRCRRANSTATLRVKVFHGK
jgi:hypothetical protein